MPAWSKKFIARVLRDKGITEISFAHTEADGATTTPNFHVPAEGVDWDRGFPSLKQVQEVALNFGVTCKGL